MNQRQATLTNWTNTGSFTNRPLNGWLHPNEQLSSNAGVTYRVRFLGSIAVFESMKSLNFDTRTAVAKECIYRICSVVYPKATFRKSKQLSCLLFTQRSLVDNYLADEAEFQFAEIDVNFTITADSLSVIREDNGNLIYHHRMQTVSFASEGDGELIDFIAYIAKDDNGRKCHVLECSGGIANEVITTIGQAFEIRYKQYLLKKPSPMIAPKTLDLVLSNSSFECDEDQSPLLSGGRGASVNWQSTQLAPRQSPRPNIDSQSKATMFNFSEATGCDSPVQLRRNDSVDHIRVGSVIYSKPIKPNTSPLDVNETTFVDEDSVALPPANLQPYDEPWFHGKISRQECEQRLLRHGDFLVRETPTTSGQFVLSGRHEGDVKHLLLVDPKGRVRTKDQLFTSVSHLINYHFCNSVPIVAIDSELLLVFPVRRPEIPA